MANMIDLLMDADGNLQIKSNDLRLGNSDAQNINDILRAVKGDFKRSPQTGLNAINFSNSTISNADIKAQTKLQLELDGFRVKDVIVSRTNGDLNIEPYAER